MTDADDARGQRGWGLWVLLAWNILYVSFIAIVPLQVILNPYPHQPWTEESKFAAPIFLFLTLIIYVSCIGMAKRKRWAGKALVVCWIPITAALIWDLGANIHGLHYYTDMDWSEIEPIGWVSLTGEAALAVLTLAFDLWYIFGRGRNLFDTSSVRKNANAS